MFIRTGGWWDFYIGRLHIGKSFRLHKNFEINKAPGFWYIEWLDYQIAWKRKWTVWEDHPYKGRNIRLYDQFGTFRKKDNK